MKPLTRRARRKRLKHSRNRLTARLTARLTTVRKWTADHPADTNAAALLFTNEKLLRATQEKLLALEKSFHG